MIFRFKVVEMGKKINSMKHQIMNLNNSRNNLCSNPREHLLKTTEKRDFNRLLFHKNITSNQRNPTTKMYIYIFTGRCSYSMLSR